MKAAIRLAALLFALGLITSATAQDVETKALAEALGKFDAGTFPAGSEEAKEAAESTWNFLRARRDKINQADVALWRSVQSRAQWEKVRQEKTSSLKAILFPTISGGAWPSANPRRIEPVQNNTAIHVSRTLKGDGFVVENLLYESRHGRLANPLWVTANLYCPDPVPPSAPGFVIIHSHHNPKTQGELQDMGMTWARLGCYVLVPEMLGHGERRDHPFSTEKDYAGPYKVSRQDYYFRYNLGMQLHHIGEHLIAWMAWDVMVGIDVLLTKPGIDKNRLLLLGSVAGGGDPAGLVAAIDPRLAAVAPFNFGRPQAETRVPLPDDPDLAFNYVGGGSWETTRNIAYSGLYGYLPSLMVGSIAPRGLIHAHEFAWDAERDPVWKRYQKIFSFYEGEARLAAIHGRGSVKGQPPESTHCNNIGAEHRKPLYPILKKWFDIPIPEKEYTTRFKPEDLQCWTPEWREKLKPQKAHELIAKIAAGHGAYDLIGYADRPFYNPIAAGATRTKVVRTDAKAIPGVTATWYETVGNWATARTFALRLTPAGARTPDAGPIVFAIARRGKDGFLKHRAETIAELLKRNIQVCLVDLPGTGETRPGSDVGRTSALASQASLAELIGIPMIEAQGEGLAGLLNHFRQQSIAKGVSFAFWSDSFSAANPAGADLRVPYDVDKFPVVAEALSPPWLFREPGAKGVYVRGGIGSYQSIVESPFLYVPYDVICSHPDLTRNIVRGASYDLRHVVRHGLLGRAMKLEALVDGQNRVLSQETLAKILENSKKGVADEPGKLQFATEPSTPVQIAKWFAKVLAQ